MRLRSIAGIALCLFFGSAWSGGAIADTMFRSDAAHTGVYRSKAPALSSVLWRFKTKGKLLSSPAVDGARIYVGSYDGNLYAVNAADGKMLWAFETGAPITSSPAVANGSVYFAGLDGNVYAVDAASGKKRWRFVTAGERRFEAPGIHGILPRKELMPDPFDVLQSSPAIADGVLYVGSGDHNVYALDATTGALLWKFKTGNVVHSSPAVRDGVVYVGSFDRYMYALNARSGVLEWKFQTGDDRVMYNQVGINGSAAVSRDTVYFGARDSTLYALDKTSGAVRWKHDEKGSWVIGTPAVANGKVYYATSDSVTFRALDAATGAEQFNVKYDAFCFSSPAIAASTAYFGTFGGSVYAVDLQHGTIAGHFLTDAALANRAGHTKPNGQVDIDGFYTDNSFEGIVAGLDRIYTLGSVVASPVIANGVAYIASTDGTLYALN